MGLSSARLQESGSKAEIRKFDGVGIHCGCSVASLSGPMTVSIDFGHSDENVKCVDPDEVGAALGWRQRLVAALKSISCRLRHVMRRCGGCCKLKFLVSSRCVVRTKTTICLDIFFRATCFTCCFGCWKELRGLAGQFRLKFRCQRLPVSSVKGRRGDFTCSYCSSMAPPADQRVCARVCELVATEPVPVSLTLC